MTLVRIDVIEGRRSPVQLEILADTVHSTIVEVFGTAVTERYQIITEHRPAESSPSSTDSVKAAPTTSSSSKSSSPEERNRRSVPSIAS